MINNESGKINYSGRFYADDHASDIVLSRHSISKYFKGSPKTKFYSNSIRGYS
jgi:hypothetical protein